MGLLDELAASLLRGGEGVLPGQPSDLASGVFELLGSPQGEGLEGLSQAFEQRGLGDVLSSWIGTGHNHSISPDELSDVLGSGALGQLSQRSGVGADRLPGLLAAVLPIVIDKLTPNGRVTPKAEILGFGQTLLAGAQGGTQMTSGDKKKPDFSDVQSGGSSTAPAPATPPPAAKTYTVAPGDSLSKIAKKVYGDGNQWKKIFEANRDQIKNPDLIHPGQVLKIP
jgi:uncharacterized protein YidB (DUF937 family)